MIQTSAGLPRYTDAANKTYLNLSDFPRKISYKFKELSGFDSQDPEHMEHADEDIDFDYKATDSLYALYHEEEFPDPLLSEVAYVNVDLSIQITKNEDLD
jgi:hypothetical protein